MDETLNIMDNQGLDRQEPGQNQGGILHRLRDRDLLKKRKAEVEKKETYRVESKRRRTRGEPRSSARRRGRPRKAENLPEVLPIQEEEEKKRKEEQEEEEGSVQEVPQPPAEEPLPDAEKAGPGTFVYSPLLPLAYVPMAPAGLPDVDSVQAPMVTYSSSSLFSPAPTLAPTPAPASTLSPTPAPALVPTVAPTVVPKPTGPTPNTVQPPATSSQSPPRLPAPSGQSQTENPLEAAPASDEAPLVLDLALAPAPSAVVYTTESSTREALGQVTIEDLGPDELEDVRLPQKEVAVERFDTDPSEGPSPAVVENTTMLSSPLFTSLSTARGYLK